MKSILLLILLLSCINIFCQKVTNVNWELDESQENITVTYNLEKTGTSNYFKVSLKAMIDNSPVKAASLSGDIGDYQKAGNNKKIIWNVASDLSAIEGELKISVIAIDPIQPASSNAKEEVRSENKKDNNNLTRKKIPITAGLLGGAGFFASGLGLTIVGLGHKKDSNDLYEIYKTVLDENDPIYADVSRSEYYDEANSKNKKSQIFLIAGGATIAVGAGIIVQRLLYRAKKNREFKHSQLDIFPSFGFSTDNKPIGNFNVSIVF